MNAPEPTKRPARRSRPKYDEFHETLAPPMPNQTYRSEIDLMDSNLSAGEQLARFVAVVINTLLVVRFITSLFSSNVSNTFVSFIYNLTDWVVAPFQALVGTPPLAATGFFDLPAILAAITVSIVAAIITSLIHAPEL